MIINDKVIEIEKYLDELNNILPNDFEEYQNNYEKKAACERYSEKLIEAVVDLAFLIVRENKFEGPEDEKMVFDILYDKKIISLGLSLRLQEAKGMRNILAHQYGKVDDKIVFKAVTGELEKDIRELMDSIRNSTIKK